MINKMEYSVEIVYKKWVSCGALVDIAKEIMRTYPTALVRMITPHVIIHCIKD